MKNETQKRPDAFECLLWLSSGTLLTLMREQGYTGEPTYAAIEKWRNELIERARGACEQREFQNWQELYHYVVADMKGVK